MELIPVESIAKSKLKNLWNQIEVSSSKFSLKGKSYVYLQQTTKYIFKKLSKAMLGSEVTGIFSYLQEFLSFVQNPPKIRLHKTVDSLLDIIKASLLMQIKSTGNSLKKQNGLTLDEKWNITYQLEILKTAKLNAVYLTAKMFFDQVERCKLSDQLYKCMVKL